jgi:hypothetical protein
MALVWQKVDEGRLYCHWWQETEESKVTAMTIFLAASALLFLLVGIWMFLEHSLRRTAHLPRLPFGADADPDWSSSRWSSSG